MRILVVTLCLAAFALVALAQSATWDIGLARDASKLEIVMNADGSMQEIEYYTPLAQIPEPARQAMTAAFPGATLQPIGEREHVNGVLHYEVSATEDVGGVAMDREGMFTAQGVPYSWELQMPVGEVPAPVQQTMNQRFPNAAPGAFTWEKIVLGPDPNAAPYEYHVKVLSDGKNYKMVLTGSGTVLTGYLEIPAEIEVPIDIR